MSAQSAARFTLVGYFPKLVLPRLDDWWMADNVEEICNVGECIDETPRGWIDLWKHNACFFYDSVEAAEAVAAIDPRRFEVFAYRVLDRRFDESGESDILLRPVSPAPLAPDWRMIGYDPVECTQGFETGAAVECSPLSCNRVSKEVAVNRFCLIDEFDRALDLAAKFGAQAIPVEPGPYYLFEVWRRGERAAR